MYIGKDGISYKTKEEMNEYECLAKDEGHLLHGYDEKIVFKYNRIVKSYCNKF